MSSPACADGYDTPAQQREDSTTFMVAKVSSTSQDGPSESDIEVRRVRTLCRDAHLVTIWHTRTKKKKSHKFRSITEPLEQIWD